MKPTPFTYHVPNTIDQAARILGSDPENSRVLAGGQSLVSMLNLRLVTVGNLIDINRIPGLDYVRVEAGGVIVGALARHNDVESSHEVRRALPLLTSALSHVAHSQIRNRGTIVGSLCHADPAAELPAVWLALDGELTAQSEGGTRTIRADEFFISSFTTTLEPNEVVTEVRFSGTTGATGWSFEEVTKRHGDFALAGVVTLVTLKNGAVSSARIVPFGVGSKPIRITSAEQQLLGVSASAIDDALLDQVAAAVSAAVDPANDIHASEEYRRHVAGVLTRRGLRRAIDDAQQRA
ncbi:FAD binding domain-containing protein [Aminobacter niigataensis]|uniref:FAD binding domain-containing protein n=1 Tax=Aminobacter niigataensis TaxID=83265 RepID=UPI0024C6C221|nr:xanthine dehydrogenase family protein subunit M [Aminobacter niigataensis]CAI2931818.1 6-hydroxypseudooxynicotine dehydrogenase complex subunit alpha [Aminobacter niigataensis]